MGNNDSNLLSSEKAVISKYQQELENDYTFLGLKTDPRYGEIKLYEERFPQPGQIRQQVMLIEVPNSDSASYNILRNKIARRADIHHPNLCHLVSFHSTIEKRWCTDFYCHYILFEYSPISLEHELHDRSKLSSQKNAIKVNLGLLVFFRARTLVYSFWSTTSDALLAKHEY